jgi:transposase
MVSVGIDLHRRRSDLVGVDGLGGVVWKHRISSSPADFLRVFGELEPGSFEVAFEATYGWGWLADLLQDAGIPAHMSHPLATKAISSARVKNDTVDATTLAQLLRTHLLPEAWIAPLEAREARRLVRSRAALVRIRSWLRCQVHAVLADHGIVPEMSDLFGIGGRRFLAEVSLPPLSRNRITTCLRLIDALTGELDSVDQEMRAVFRDHPALPRLVRIPGVGFLTAATVVAEVWDVSRFAHPEQLCSWAGLTPTEHSSAEHTRRGHISKQGSRWLRWILVEAATNHTGRDPALRDFEARIARRRGLKIARLALARRLLTLCFYALRDPGGCAAYPLVAA